MHDPQLAPIRDKVLQGRRLSFEDGVALYRTHDLLALGALANHVREQRHGNLAYFVWNIHVNHHTNVCVATCDFCALAAQPGEPRGYTMKVQEIVDNVAALPKQEREVHIVGGLHPELPWSYFTDMLRGIKQVRAVLAERHRFDARDERAISINDSAEIRQAVGGMAAGLKIVLLFIGTLTLMIGGVGVMNIMLVSVAERTREIGIRKSLGARRWHILTQILSEGLTLTALGGLLGLVVAAVLTRLIGTLPLLGPLFEDTSGRGDVRLSRGGTARDRIGVALPAAHPRRVEPTRASRSTSRVAC